MEQILSSKTAFFAIFTALIAGVGLVATGYIEWGLVCFGIAGVLLFLFLLFRRQHIDITDIKCNVSQNVIIGHFHPMEVRGFIKARHPVELLDCKLMVSENKREYYLSGGIGGLPEIIDSVSRLFIFHILLERENTGQMIDWGLVYIKVAGRLLHTPPFQIKTKLHDDKGSFKEIVGKLLPKTKLLKDEGETTKKRLHELFDNVSKPIK
ncbi:hypothetical protein ES703_13496 [subsurface metagenome]|nr:hypothetical protein [Dehalococcoidia bacterium]